MRPETKAKYPGDWKEISKVLRDKVGKCERCGKVPGEGQWLTVHHKDYNPANNKRGNLIVLCPACHFYVQSVIDKEDPRQYEFSFVGSKNG